MPRPAGLLLALALLTGSSAHADEPDSSAAAAPPPPAKRARLSAPT